MLTQEFDLDTALRVRGEEWREEGRKEGREEGREEVALEMMHPVLCQIQDDTVYVDYILDCRKDYSWLAR